MITGQNFKFYDKAGREITVDYAHAPDLISSTSTTEMAYKKLLNEEYSIEIELSEEERANLRKTLKIDEYDDIRKVILAALEKQMPRKPIKYEYMGEEYDETKTHCPCCNGVLLFGISSPYDVYCHHCGQALDWSEKYGKENEK